MARIIAVDLPGISASLPKDRIRFPDVFDPAVQRRLAARVAAVCRRHRDDPSVLGFAFTRDPLWDGRRARELVGTDWVSAIRAMNRSSPGKHRYLKYLQERYADAGTVATFYRTKAPSFDELLDDPFDRVPHEVGVVESNDRDFRKIIAKEFYRVVGTAVREAAPDRLFCGDRFRFREHPPEVFEALREHVDVLCVEFPEGPDYDPLYFKIVEALVGRPVLVSAVAWPAAKAGDGGQDGGGTANDTAGADRVEFYRQLASTPAIIGIHAEFTPAGEARERLNELAGLHDSPTLPPNWAALSSACETARTAAAGG